MSGLNRDYGYAGERFLVAEANQKNQNNNVPCYVPVIQLRSSLPTCVILQPTQSTTALQSGSNQS